MDLNIQHDINRQRFFAVKNSKECDLKYRKINDNTLDYYSTYVPDELRNQGIAGKITAYALQYAKDNNYRVIPSCPYVKNYIDAHPEYQTLLRK